MGEITLTVSNLSTKLTDVLYLYQQNRILCDCCIQCSDGEVYAHKIILAMWGMFGFYIDTIDTIQASKFTTADVNNFMKLIYSGKSSLNLNAAFRVAQFGKQIGIKLRCIANSLAHDSLESALSTLRSSSCVEFQFNNSEKNILYIKSLPDYQSSFAATTNVRCREPIKKTKSMSGNSREPTKRAKSVSGNIKEPVKKRNSVSGKSRKQIKRAKSVSDNSKEQTKRAKSISDNSKEPIKRAKSISGVSREPTKRAKTITGNSRKPTKRAKSMSGNSKESTERAKSIYGNSKKPIKRSKSMYGNSREPTKRAKSLSGNSKESTKRAKSMSGNSKESIKRANSMSCDRREPVKRRRSIITDKGSKNLDECSLCQSSDVSSTVLFDENKSAIFPTNITDHNAELEKKNTCMSYNEAQPEIVIEVKTENCKNLILKTEKQENED
ncbi:protein SON-like [Saccostrea echinata]|uniref:protein SON-like n=1 Tax=Saccostrea echinata TaxID=191078 RepID=UPI002A8124A8|nr:protein SON-like [Saccostrea echinata]